MTGNVHLKSTFEDTASEPITEGAVVMAGDGEAAWRTEGVEAL